MISDANGSLRGVVVAAPNSGSGKTTVALGLMAALGRRGLRVAPFKVGPDFIDPGHHRRVCGRASRNLDGWMLDRDTNRRIFARQAAAADIAVVEGVMGLFDGFDGSSEAGSTAQMAKWLGLPVLLVVDARSMARSAAALVQGFERFDPQLTFAGVLFNRVGSPRHLEYLRQALDGHVAMPCLGALGRDGRIAMPERHLGLVTDEDRPMDQEALSHLAKAVVRGCDLDALLAGLAPVRAAQAPPLPEPARRAVRIGVAQDRAFCFYYPENIELLEANGASIVYFSPIDAPDLPADLDGLYFGGGYPELHAEALARNRVLRDRVLAASRSGMPIYGECGGFMYLCRDLEDAEGRRHEMTGCFPLATRMTPKLRSLGYREAVLTRPTLLGGPGRRVRGHEFHYSELVENTGEVPLAYRVSDRQGADRGEGFQAGNTLGSYLHLHLGSCPEAAASFVDACAAWKEKHSKAVAGGAPAAGNVEKR